jgi:hypothetical protein
MRSRPPAIELPERTPASYYSWPQRRRGKWERERRTGEREHVREEATPVK